jgi:NADPH2:quinone reductase
MRAVVCRCYGAPEDLVIDEVPDPVPSPDQLLVRVRAAAVNFPDVLLIAGKYQLKIPPPFIPGNEVAGEVISVGISEGNAADGARFSPGQRVSGTPSAGSPSGRCSTRAKVLGKVVNDVD